MLARSTLCPRRAFANRYPPAIVAPFSAATASFTTCTRPNKAQQPHSSSPAARRTLPTKFIVRNASTASSQPATGVPPTSQPKLTWNDFFALRRTRRRIGQGCSVVGAVTVTYYGLTTMMTNGYDATLSAQLGGLDPFMLMGLSTFGMLGVGWLIGPIFGNKVFNLAYRGVLAEFTAKDSGFFSRIKRHRVDPTASSLANPPPDYYGEKIGSVSGYRRWLKDQRAFNLKTGRYRGGKAI